jgi:hypothetical protein
VVVGLGTHPHGSWSHTTAASLASEEAIGNCLLLEVALGHLVLLLGMLLTLLLDALSAVGEARAMVLLLELLFLGVLPLGVLIYLLVQLANQRLDEQLDHEWTEQKAQAAARKRSATWILLLLCCAFMGVMWSNWPAD